MSERVDLLKAIDKLPYYIGAEPFGNDEAPIELLCNFIVRRYPNIRAASLLDAFELAAAGQLFTDSQPVDVRTYGKHIHMELAGRVLSAYAEKLRGERTRPKAGAADGSNGSEEYFRPTPLWHYQHLLTEIQETGELPAVHLWETIVAHMASIGLIPPYGGDNKPKRRDKLKVDSIGDVLRQSPHRIIVERYFLAQGLITVKEVTSKE